MLDANDIQIISKIVSDALAEERKHTEAMFAEERKHTEAMFAEERKHTGAMFAEERKHTEAMFAEERKHTEAMFAQQKEELRTEMLAISAQQKKEMHEDMLAISAQQKKEMHEDMLAISAQQKKEMHEDMMTIIESEVTPQFRILAEAHEVLLERMTPPEEIEDIKDHDIFILKEAVKNLGTRVKAPAKRRSKRSPRFHKMQQGAVKNSAIVGADAPGGPRGTAV